MLRSAVTAILLMSLPALASDPPRYAVQVIGGLEPGTGGSGGGGSGLVSFPLGLNNNGRTVGYAPTSTSQQQIINWKGGSVYTVAPLPGTSRSFGNRVNILGRIAGSAQLTDSNGQVLQSRAVRWRGLIPQDLGTLGGNYAAALGINDADRIVGYSTLPGESQVRAFLWDNGVMTSLAAPAGATQSYAYDISNNNHVVGVYGSPAPAKPVLWHNGYMYPLSVPTYARTGSASAVNDSGVVVGNYEINQYTGAYAAAAWYGGLRQDLGNLGGGVPYAIAADINNHHQIVGTSNSPSGYTGFVYHDGVMYDLRTRLLPGSQGVQILSAHAINDSGQIAAAAMVNGRITAVLLTPVFSSTPSPGSLAVVGAFGLVAWRRRRA